MNYKSLFLRLCFLALLSIGNGAFALCFGVDGHVGVEVVEATHCETVSQENELCPTPSTRVCTDYVFTSELTCENLEDTEDQAQRSLTKSYTTIQPKWFGSIAYSAPPHIRRNVSFSTALVAHMTVQLLI